jgi:putative ABC transport system substrate-binding protein
LAQSSAQIPETAAQLASTNPDIIVAAGTPSVFPAKDAAGSIPVVFVATFDPVTTGLVPSLARPGGNVTGLITISGDVVAKRLELIKEFFPALTKVAILVRGVQSNCISLHTAVAVRSGKAGSSAANSD